MAMDRVRIPRGQCRGQILSTTLTAIALRGIHGLTLRDIAADAGVSLGSTTYHFPSRAMLIDAALTTHVGHTEAIVDAAASASHGPHRSDVHAALLDLFADRDRVLVRNELHLVAARAGDHVELYHRSLVAITTLVVAAHRTAGRPDHGLTVWNTIADLEMTATDTAVHHSRPTDFTAEMTAHITANFAGSLGAPL